jgi:L-ribulose-5-phosphate 4-epimerase
VSALDVPATRAEARELVVLVRRRMLAEHLVAYTAGNISTRIAREPDLVAVTPGSTAYDTLCPEDIVIVALDGTLVEGARTPTAALPLHTLAYRDCPDVAGIVHMHSPAAMAMAALGMDLPPVLHCLVSACGGGIVVAPYARGATTEVADAYLRAFPFGPVPEVPADDVARIRATQWAPAWFGRAGTPTHGG